MARHGPRLASAQHPWPGTRLHLFTNLIPTPWTRPAPPAEIRGPCRTNRQGFIAVVPFAASYALRAVPLPSPRTAYYVLRTTYPQGGHTGPPLRRDGAHHEPRATSYKPRASFLPPPPGEVAAGRRGVVGWEVGCRKRHKNGFPQATGYRLQAAFQTPSLALRKDRSCAARAYRTREHTANANGGLCIATEKRTNGRNPQFASVYVRIKPSRS